MASEVEVVEKNPALLAMDPAELAQAHNNLRAWASSMQERMTAEARELAASVKNAREHKWASSTLSRHQKLAEQRRDFYGKIVAALDAGFVIVPNFPMDPWVVRTDRKKPGGRGKVRRRSYSADRWFPTPTRRLPPGEGRFVGAGATCEVWQEEVERDGKTRTVHCSMPIEFDEAPDFPFQFASPHVMHRVAAARDARVFDEIGIAEDTARNGDPILCGRLLNPRPGHPAVTFFIAWNIDIERV